MTPKIVKHDFPSDQYYPIITEKSQIYLHHTVSGIGVSGDINWWEQTPERVSTCVIISRDGTIHKLYKSEYWSHHLGVKIKYFDKYGILRKYRKSVRSGKMFVSNNVELNEESIGSELDSWGGLVSKAGRYYNAVWKNGKYVAGRAEVKAENVIDYGVKIRGFRFYEKYTPQQINSQIWLLKYWNDKYGIPICYNDQMWNISKDALKGKEGVWAHVSVRPDKSDAHPQPELIEALNTL